MVMTKPWTRQRLRGPVIDVLVTFRQWGENQQLTGEWNWSEWDHGPGGRSRPDLSSRRLKIAMSNITGVDDITWWAAAEDACRLFGFEPSWLPRGVGE